MTRPSRTYPSLVANLHEQLNIIERMVLDEVRLRKALSQWRCPSCGGKPNSVSLTQMNCKVCKGSGLHPTASAALEQEQT